MIDAMMEAFEETNASIEPSSNVASANELLTP